MRTVGFAIGANGPSGARHPGVRVYDGTQVTDVGYHSWPATRSHKDNENCGFEYGERFIYLANELYWKIVHNVARNPLACADHDRRQVRLQAVLLELIALQSVPL